VELTLSHRPLRAEPLDRPFPTEKAARSGSPLEIGTLVFRCPTMAGEIESGLYMDRETFIGIQNLNIRVHCSDCGEFHKWRVAEGILSWSGLAKDRKQKARLRSKEAFHGNNGERGRAAWVVS
jgi:hypothetical protein